MARKLTTKEVIKKFEEIHGERYDYSQVVYRNTRTPVTILCTFHGPFFQTPDSHKHGKGCPKCAGIGKLSQKAVIHQFKEIHGDRYDYSKVNYKGNSKKVTIICKIHGPFFQIPNSHKIGRGCPKCAGKGITTVDVVAQFKEIHGDKYDYSKVNFKNSTTPVRIICPDHGLFIQRPANHKSGQGCPKCSGVGELTQIEVITQFKETHGNKYDYSKVKYENSEKKVTIICETHGPFKQSPTNHKNGSGCPKCAGKGMLSQKEIIEQFKETHGERYDYSKVNYTGHSKKVIIICKIHGLFKQKPGEHKKGSGCPKCAGNKQFSTDEIVQIFKKVHGDRYDYTKVNYKSSSSSIEIICKEHGIFKQTPGAHKTGQGCPKCAGFGFTTKDIIQQFEAVHGKKYDYSLVKYEHKHKPVTIICKLHGKFNQYINDHLRGIGCRTCNIGWFKPKILQFIESIENKRSIKNGSN